MFRKEGAITKETWRYIVAVSALLLAIGIFANSVSAGIVTNLPAKQPSAPASAAQPQPAGEEQPFNCADIKKYGIDKQMNFHAMEILAACSGLDKKSPTNNLNLNTLN